MVNTYAEVAGSPRCLHYARVMQNVSRTNADAIFFASLFGVFILLYISCHHIKRGHSAASFPELPPHNIRLRRRALLISSLCYIISNPLMTLQVFAGFSIQFCHGEDLMMLYWAFGSALQVGNSIAIFGIALSQ